MATQELVVPRSMPMTFATESDYLIPGLFVRLSPSARHATRAPEQWFSAAGRRAGDRCPARIGARLPSARRPSPRAARPRHGDHGGAQELAPEPIARAPSRSPRCRAGRRSPPAARPRGGRDRRADRRSRRAPRRAAQGRLQQLEHHPHALRDGFDVRGLLGGLDGALEVVGDGRASRARLARAPCAGRPPRLCASACG